MVVHTVVLIGIAVAVAIALVFVKKGKDLYIDRACQGALWRRKFPEASKNDIRHFLRFFASCFAVRKKHMLLLSPADTLLEIYRARYPSRADPDALEFETLSKELQRKYGLSLEKIWRDALTLGELFSYILNTQQGTPADRPTAAQSTGD
jgi:hypothetical protein